MSRRIISYADLGPSKINKNPNTPNADRRSPPSNEPPRKRVRTDHEVADVSIETVEAVVPVDGTTSTASGVSPPIDSPQANGQGGRRKNKKQPRAGNPSGVPWTQHWDAQPFVSTDNTELTYDVEVPVNVTAESGGSGRAPKMEEPVEPNSTGKSRTNGVSISHLHSNQVGDTKSMKKGGRKKQKRKGAVVPAPSPSKGDTVPLAEEEWDDSALIDAWNAAEDQYREMHGGKKWRLAPVKHSFLWHSTPDMDEETDMEIDDSQPGKEEEQDEEGDGAYDESREATSLQRPPSALFPHASGELPFFKSLPEFPAVSNIAIIEEAFHRVKEASYALGYWTAVYQMHAHHGKASDDHSLAGEAEQNDEADFAPTQR